MIWADQIYLLDDPLSAVDAHVGKSIFQKSVALALHDYNCHVVSLILLGES